MAAQLPPIAGKPYKQPLRLKPYQVEEPCAEGEKCKAPCWCSGLSGRHTKGDHARLDPPGSPLHTHTRTVDPEYLAPSGSGRLERKASGELVYHTPWTKKHTPFARSAATKEAKPRVESSAKAYMRLLKECAAFVEADSYASTIGQTAANGYKIVSTNGDFALLAAGDGQHYLELALGVWPLTLWFRTAESPLVFESAGREWRFVLAPMRGGDLETMRKRVHAALVGA